MNHCPDSHLLPTISQLNYLSSHAATVVCPMLYGMSVCLTCLGKASCSGLPEDPLLGNGMNAHLYNHSII